MNNQQQTNILYGGFGIMFFLLFLLIFQNYFQNPLRGKEGKIIRNWLVVADDEIREAKQNFNQLLTLRSVFVEKTGNIPAFSDALAHLNIKNQNFDRLGMELNNTKDNRKAFEGIVNDIGNYTHELLQIVSDTRDLAIDEELKNALLPYQQDLDILKDENKRLERSLQAARQRLPKAIQERDFWKNEVTQMQHGKIQADSARFAIQNRIVILENEITTLKASLGLSKQKVSLLSDSINILTATKKQVIEEQKTMVEKNKQLTKEKEQAYKLAPLITIQSNRKRIDYDPKIGIEKLKRRKQKRLQIRFELPSIQIKAMEKQIFSDYYATSVNVNIYKENGHLALSKQMNLYKGRSGNLYISQLALGEVYRAEILQAGKNITQNGSFEFKL